MLGRPSSRAYLFCFSWLATLFLTIWLNQHLGTLDHWSGDFLVFQEAAQRVIRGENPYDFSRTLTEQVWAPPTIFGVIWIFSTFPDHLFQYLWRLLSVICVIVVLALFAWIYGRDSNS